MVNFPMLLANPPLIRERYLLEQTWRFSILKHNESETDNPSTKEFALIVRTVIDNSASVELRKYLDVLYAHMFAPDPILYGDFMANHPDKATIDEDARHMCAAHG